MKAKNLISNIAIIAVVVAFAVACFITGDINNPVGTLWSLFPPVVAIGLALITKEVYSSLFIGIAVAGILAYSIIAFIQYRKVKKVPLDIALKNVE